MNNVSSEKKAYVLKSLAVLGFISIIILIAWLSVKLVNVAPGAFSSLASLAESVNQFQDEAEETVPLLVTSNISLANQGEPVELSWDKASVPGTYTFSYACSDGVAVDLLNVDGVRSIACDTNYNIGNKTTISIKADSEKKRYASLDYTVSFLRTNDTTPSASGSESITVVNTSINDIVVNNDQEVAADPEETETTIDPEETPVEVTPVEEAPVEPVTPVTKPVTTNATPNYQQEFVYAIPTSDPNGRIDLSTRFLNIGTIVGDTFFVGAVKQNEKGAIQFEVKNYGTKTSDVWTYSVALPDGSTYKSDEQKALKPNERALIAIGFSTTAKDTHKFVVAVKESSDKNTINNQFAETVVFVK